MFTTTARRHPGEILRLHGEIPRRHRGVRVVALSIAAIQTAIKPVRRHFPSVIGIAASNSPAGGGAHNSGSRSVVAHLSRSARVETRANGPCAERDSTSVRVVPAIRGANFNGRNAEVARIGERVAVGDGSHASDALICAATHAGTTRRIKPEIDTGPSIFNADRAPVSPIGDQARLSRGRFHQRPPAFRSWYRQFGGCVRLSGGQTFQCHQNTLRAHDVACVNAERISYRRGRQQSNDRGAAIKGAWRGVLMGLTFNAAAAGNVDPRTKAAA